MGDGKDWIRRVLFTIKRAVLLGVVWLALTGGDPAGLAFGAVAVGAATWLSLRLLPPVSPVRLLRLSALVPGFLWRSFAGGLDVAWRAFHPRLPIDPGWITVPVRLSDGGRVTLGGELSLMPGTLVAGSRNGHLLVHLLDRGGDFEQSIRREERRLQEAVAERPA